MLGDTAEHVDMVPNLREFAIKKEEVYSRALDHARVNEYDEAMAAFDELIQLDPESAATYMRRADVHVNLGYPERAIDDYTEAINRDP